MKNYLNNEGEETDRLIREAISIYEDVIDLLVEYGADRDLKVRFFPPDNACLR